MIAYDLRCIEGHVFEAWFKDRLSFEDQKESRQVICPACGSSGIEIAFTGCSIRTERPYKPLAEGNSFLHNLSRYIEKNFEDVGDRFAEEARRIYYQEAERRNIRGLTTPEEEQDMKEEGVEFFKIPLLKMDS